MIISNHGTDVRCQIGIYEYKSSSSSSSAVAAAAAPPAAALAAGKLKFAKDPPVDEETAARDCESV